MSKSLDDCLINYLARSNLNSALSAEVKNAIRNVEDWPEFVRQLKNEGIESLAYWNLSRLNLKDHIPNLVMEELQQYYNYTRWYNSIRFSVFRRLLNDLKEEEIEVVILKGAVLASIVYPDIGLRPMLDFDFLVLKHDLPLTHNTIKRMGFAFRPDDGNYPEGYYLEFKSRLNYLKQFESSFRILPLQIEVHPRIFTKDYGIELETTILFDTAKEVMINDICTKMLSPEYFLFHLCMHLHTHCYSRLIRLTDICAYSVYCSRKIDWPHFVDVIGKFGARAPVYYVLAEAVNYLNASIPSEVLIELRPKSIIGIGHTKIPRKWWSCIESCRGKAIFVFFVTFLLLDSSLKTRFLFLLKSIFRFTIMVQHRILAYNRWCRYFRIWWNQANQ